MSRSVLILRPEPGNAATVTLAKGQGLNAVGFPLFEIEAVEWATQPASAYDGLLLTSANAIRRAGPGLLAYRELPVIAVGAVTAETARQAGLRVTAQGSSGVDDLLATLRPSTLLHLVGKDATPLSRHAHTVQNVITYRSTARAAPPEFWAALEERPVALLHSARAAVHFAALVEQKKMKWISIAAISAKVAKAAGNGWEAVALAAYPRDEAVIEAALSLAHSDNKAV